MMDSLSRELANIGGRLADRWIDRITAMKKEGKTHGRPDYDAACRNLIAVDNEFFLEMDEE